MGAAVATLCWGVGASGQTKPEALNPGAWVDDTDYPAEALARREGGTTAVEVQVDAAGKPTGCRVTTSSDSVLLDTTTCRLVIERGRFRPATDAGGKAVAGAWQMRFTWNAPTEAGTMRVPLTSHAQVERMVLDANGRITDCTTRHVGELGYTMPGCFKVGNAYFMQQHLGSQLRSGVLTGLSFLLVDGERLPPDAPTSDLPPYWTMDRTFVVQADGSIADCVQRESNKGVIPCEMMQSYAPLADGRPRRVTSETRWSFQPDK